MRKNLVMAFVLILMLTFSINAKKAAVPASIEGKKVLFVANAPEGNLLPEDQVTFNHLTALKLVCTPKDAKDVKSEDAELYDLVFVAESVSSGKVGKKYSATTKPVVLCEHYVADDMFFAGTETNKDFGQTEMKYKEVSIVAKNKKHALAAGLSGNVAVYKETGKFSFSVPKAKAIIIATLPDDPKKPVIYAFEKGAKNLKKEAIPARRVFFYLFQGQEGNQTEAGWKLFDASINWALGAVK